MLQRMQLEEISELLNMLSALVPLAPTLLMKRQIAAIALSLLLVAIDLGTYVKPPLIPVNNQNRDRKLNSFSDEECDRELRFTRVEIEAILTELHLPQTLVMDNGLRVDGESAFLYFLYRMHYPNTLAMGQEMWGREYSELDRIYNFITDHLYERCSHCVLNRYVSFTHALQPILILELCQETYAKIFATWMARQIVFVNPLAQSLD